MGRCETIRFRAGCRRSRASCRRSGSGRPRFVGRSATTFLASTLVPPSNLPPPTETLRERPPMSEIITPNEPLATDGVVSADDPEHAGSLGELLRIAVPLMISSGSVSVMHLANAVFLTWDSSTSLAAVVPAGILQWTLISSVFGTVQYANTFVAQY